MAAPLAWTAYLVLPVAGWGLFEGFPLSPLSVAALCAVWWIWGMRRALGWGRLLIVLVVVKLLLGGALLVDRGFLARYFANAAWSAPQEQSVEFPHSAGTRIDRRLRFGANDAADIPLAFFNELRFNFYRADDPERGSLPFSTEWTGYVDMRREETTTFYLAGDRLAADLSVDGRPTVTLQSEQRRAVGAATLPPGWHRLVVRLSARQGAARRFDAGHVDPASGEDRPLDARAIFVAPVSRTRAMLDGLVRWISGWADAVLLAALAWWSVISLSRCRRDTAAGAADLFGRGVTAALWLAACFDAFLFALPSSGRLLLLGGGGDPLSYESFARDIVLHGPLMLLGEPVGRAAPFYYQPLYPYALALFHRLFGEGFFGIFFVQRLLLAATAFSVARTASLLFDRATGRVVFVASVVFLYMKAGPWAGVTLGEALFIPLVAVWMQLLVTAAVTGPSPATIVLAGAIGGLATLSRSTLLLAWLLVLPAWAVALHRRGNKALRWTCLLLVVLVGVTGLATLRNWIAAGRFVPLTTSFSVNLFLGNEPPPSVNVSSTALQTTYDALGLDQNTRSVIEYARQAPGRFARNLGRKALYTLGLFRLSGLSPAATGSVPYAMVWALAAVGATVALRRRAAASGIAALLPGLASSAHFLSVVAIFPNIYGDRLILPLYVLLLPYAGYGVIAMANRFRFRPDPETIGVALVAAVLGSAAFPAAGEAAVFSLAAVVSIAALASRQSPRLQWRHAPYAAYLAVITTSAFAHSTTGGTAEYWRQILFLAIAFSTGRLLRSSVARKAVVGLLAATAGVWLVTHGNWASGWTRPVLAISRGAAESSQLWTWHVAAEIARTNGWLLGGGLGVWSTLNEAGGAAGQFVGVTAGVGVLGLVCYVAMWIRTLAITFAGALAGQPTAAAIHAVLVALFVVHQRQPAGASSPAGLLSLVCLGVAFGLAEAEAGNRTKSGVGFQTAPMTPIGTAGPRSSPMATPR